MVQYALTIEKPGGNMKSVSKQKPLVRSGLPDSSQSPGMQVETAISAMPQLTKSFIRNPAVVDISLKVLAVLPLIRRLALGDGHVVKPGSGESNDVEKRRRVQ